MILALQTSATAGIDQGEAPSYYFEKFLEDNPVFGFITWRWILPSGFNHMFSSSVFLGLLALLHLHNPIAHGKGCKKVSNLVDIPDDCLFQIFLSLSRRDLINTTLCSKALFSTISSSSFGKIYQLHHKYSPSALLCLFDRESLDTMALTLNEPVVLSLDFVKDKRKWTIIDSRDGLLLLLAQSDADSFLVCNPMTKKCAEVPSPPDLPPLYSVLAAGLAPEANSSWSVIALFGCTVKSVSRKDERCWVGSFNATDGSWEGKHQEVKFRLPDSRMGVRHPSILVSGYWNNLVFNMNVLSVHLPTLRLISRNLPFVRNVLRIHPRVLGRNRMGELCLLMHDGIDLIVMSYGKSSEASEVRRYSGFVFDMDLSFAERNCMLLMDGLICFDIELGDVLLPFMVNLGQRIENAVPYEMAWPPKPHLQHGVPMPEDRIGTGGRRRCLKTSSPGAEMSELKMME